MQERIAATGRRLAELPSGRKAKWAILGVWILVFIAMGPLAGKFEDAQENDPADYLPAKAESVKAIEELEDFPVGRHRGRDHGLQSRRRSRARRPGGDRGRSRLDQRGPARGRRGDGPADRLRGRHLRAADHADHGRGRDQRGARHPRRRHRRHQGRPRGPARGPRREGDRCSRFRGGRDRRLRAAQRNTSLLHGAARPDPADHHLPQPDLLADPLLLGDPGRAHLPRDGLPARRGRRHRHRPDRAASCPCSSSEREPTTRSCWSRATARSCAATRTSTRPSASRCARRAPPSSPRA